MHEIESYKQKHGFRQFCPKAVLFDMDGVIYNSMPNHAYSWHKAMASFDINMTPEEAYLYEGMRGVETIKLKARQQWLMRKRNGCIMSSLASLPNCPRLA